MPAPRATGRDLQRMLRGNRLSKGLAIHFLDITFRKLRSRIAQRQSTILRGTSMRPRFLLLFCQADSRANCAPALEISRSYLTSEMDEVPTPFSGTSGPLIASEKDPWRWRKIWEFVPMRETVGHGEAFCTCLLYTSPSPRDRQKTRM